MAGFASVAAVGKSIESLLNEAFTADNPIAAQAQPIPRARIVQTDDFDGKGGEGIPRPAVSILLYRIESDPITRASWSATGSIDGRVHLPLDLHYLLTAWADDGELEHRILGRTMQVLEQSGGFTGPRLHPDGDWLPGESVQLYLESLGTDDLMRTFDSLRCHFRLSVPYLARVVVLTSDGGAPAPDVTTVVTGAQPPVMA